MYFLPKEQTKRTNDEKKKNQFSTVQLFGDDIDNDKNKTTAKNAVEFINRSENLGKRRAQFKYWWINLAVCLGLVQHNQSLPYCNLRTNRVGYMSRLHLTFSFCVSQMRLDSLIMYISRTRRRSMMFQTISLKLRESTATGRKIHVKM